jgi:hypothetical protein
MDSSDSEMPAVFELAACCVFEQQFTPTLSSSFTKKLYSHSGNKKHYHASHAIISLPPSGEKIIVGAWRRLLLGGMVNNVGMH